MRLSQKAIDEFKEIHKSHFGDDLTDDEAQEMGIRLLRIVDLVYEPLPQDHECVACTSNKSHVDRSP